MTEIVSHDDGSITIRVPVQFQRRGGRKVMVSPDGATGSPASRPNIDKTLVYALARAWRWHKMLETEAFQTIQDLAKAESQSASYIARHLRLTQLAPAIVDMILDGRQSAEVQLEGLLKSVPLEWEAQVGSFRAPPTSGH